MPGTPKSLDLNKLPAEVRAAFEAERVARFEAEQTARSLKVLNASLDQARAALETSNQKLEDANQRLEALVKELRHTMYGKRSERLSEDDRQLAFEDLEVGIAEVQEQTSVAVSAAPKKKRAPANRNLGNLPEDLPRVEVTLAPETTQCPCGCGAMKPIGEDITERLDIIPAQFRVIRTIRPKYACPKCSDGVFQAKSPAYLIEGALPSEGLIAHVLVSKYADHCPLYRQAQIYSRSGLDLHRSTLAGWVGKASFHLNPVVERLAEKLKQSTKLFMDETRAPVLDPGRGKTKTGFLWALARDDRPWSGEDPPGVVYFYADGRSGEHAEKFLKGYNGILQVDGYTGYNRLTQQTREDGPLQLAFCWAHARRKLKEIFDKDGSDIAAEGLRRIAEFYAIEGDIKGQSSDQRLAVRKDRTAPLMADFEIWLRDQRSRISAKSRLGEKLAYISRHWDGLNVFLEDGRVEIDSNAVERTIRPIALNRKNALFAGHDEGGTAWGRIASLIETCKLNGVEPFAYLKATLEALAKGHPQSRLDDLLPWNFTQEIA